MFHSIANECSICPGLSSRCSLRVLNNERLRSWSFQTETHYPCQSTVHATWCSVVWRNQTEIQIINSLVETQEVCHWRPNCWPNTQSQVNCVARVLFCPSYLFFCLFCLLECLYLSCEMANSNQPSICIVFCLILLSYLSVSIMQMCPFESGFAFLCRTNIGFRPG